MAKPKRSTKAAARKCRTMANLPPNNDAIALKIPYSGWQSDTLITDSYGNPIFSVLDLDHNPMGLYRAILGDQHGKQLVYITRRLCRKVWQDGWDFCTYEPNFTNQPEYKEKDLYGKSVYPHSLLEIQPTKASYRYSVHQPNMKDMDLIWEAMQGWIGATVICCTPLTRYIKWKLKFHQPGVKNTKIKIDQSMNLLEIEPGQDVLAALCVAYAFDKALCQPMVTIVGYQETEYLDGSRYNNDANSRSQNKKKSKTKKILPKREMNTSELPAMEDDPNNKALTPWSSSSGPSSPKKKPQPSSTSENKAIVNASNGNIGQNFVPTQNSNKKSSKRKQRAKS